jgi:hypothetical protein
MNTMTGQEQSPSQISGDTLTTPIPNVDTSVPDFGVMSNEHPWQGHPAFLLDSTEVPVDAYAWRSVPEFTANPQPRLSASHDVFADTVGDISLSSEALVDIRTMAHRTNDAARFNAVNEQLQARHREEQASHEQRLIADGMDAKDAWLQAARASVDKQLGLKSAPAVKASADVPKLGQLSPDTTPIPSITIDNASQADTAPLPAAPSADDAPVIANPIRFLADDLRKMREEAKKRRVAESDNASPNTDVTADTVALGGLRKAAARHTVKGARRAAKDPQAGEGLLKRRGAALLKGVGRIAAGVKEWRTVDIKKLAKTAETRLVSPWNHEDMAREYPNFEGFMPLKKVKRSKSLAPTPVVSHKPAVAGAKESGWMSFGRVEE